MLLAGIISHSEETAGLIRRFLGEMTRSRGCRSPACRMITATPFWATGDAGRSASTCSFWDLSFFARGGDADAADVRESLE